MPGLRLHIAMAAADRPLSLISRAVRQALLWIYRRKGWTAVGEVPAARRYVLVAAPHTSNWDFILFLGLTDAIGIRPHYMGKHSLFRWPMRRFMLDMGGVPVNRTSRQDYVAQMAAEFAGRDDFALVIAPEGTRGGTGKWKSGFYHIAMAAGVPIQLAFVDNARKVGGLGPMIVPTGDYRADMATILRFYRETVVNFPAPEV